MHKKSAQYITPFFELVNHKYAPMDPDKKSMLIIIHSHYKLRTGYETLPKNCKKFKILKSEDARCGTIFHHLHHLSPSSDLVVAVIVWMRSPGGDANLK